MIVAEYVAHSHHSNCFLDFSDVVISTEKHLYLKMNDLFRDEISGSGFEFI